MDFLFGIAFGLLSMLGFGIQDFTMAGLSKSIGSFRTSLWINIISFLVLAALSLFLFSTKGFSAIFIIIAISAGILGDIGLLLFVKGLQIGNVSIVATIGNLWGAVTAVLGFVILAEQIAYLQILAIALIVAGTAFVSLDLKELAKFKLGKVHSGLPYALAAALIWGVYFFLVAVLAGRVGWFMAAFSAVIPAVAFLLLYGVAKGEKLSPIRKSAPRVLLASLTSIGAFLAYNIGVSLNYTDIVAPVSAAAPIVTVILAIVILKEKLTITQRLGIAAVLAGLVALSI